MRGFLSSIVHVGVLTSVMLAAQMVLAQTKSSADLTDQAKNSRKLIQLLANPKFSERERATRALYDLGLHAVDALRLATEHGDPEVRNRSHRILAEIARRDRPRRLSELLSGAAYHEIVVSDSNAASMFGIPGFEVVLSVVGDTSESRQLLASALQVDWDFVEAVLGNHRSAVQLLETRCTQLRSSVHRTSGGVVPGHVAAILIGALGQKDSISDTTAIQLYSLLGQLDGRHDPDSRLPIWDNGAFRGVVSSFIARCDGPTAVYQGLNLALRHDLRDGLCAAERVVRDGHSLPYVRQYAILTIARFGDTSQLEDLHRLLDDTQICFTRRTPHRNSHFECQVRDLAVATALHLLGYDPRLFGFVHLQTSECYVFQPHTVGFDSEDDRQHALRQFHVLLSSAVIP